LPSGCSKRASSGAYDPRKFLGSNSGRRGVLHLPHGGSDLRLGLGRLGLLPGEVAAVLADRGEHLLRHPVLKPLGGRRGVGAKDELVEPALGDEGEVAGLRGSEGCPYLTLGTSAGQSQPLIRTQAVQVVGRPLRLEVECLIQVG
jgi:hypothetical protein